MFGTLPADETGVECMAASAPSPKNLSALLAHVPPGAWVAISQDGTRVVAYAAEIRDVIDQAHKAGEPDPIITRVPQSNMALIL
jgi:hypothetical protein